MYVLRKIVLKLMRPRHEEDLVDRANNAIMPFVLVMMAMLCFAKEYGPAPWSKPLYCWTDSRWNMEWDQYAQDYCFAESTYYVLMNETIPLRGRRNNVNDQINYYQWVPFMLFFMALVCQMPDHFWKLERFHKIIRQAHDAVGNFDQDFEVDVAEGIGRHLFTMLSGRGEYDQKNEWTIYQIYKSLSNEIGRYVLCFCYLVTKVLYLATNIGQLLFITYFLGAAETPKWGLQMLEAFIKYGTAWEQSGLFPRISLCDFRIRMPGQNVDLDFTVQCILTANFLNEKIFLLLYYLFAFMSVLTILNLIWWSWIVFMPPTYFVRKMIKLIAVQIYPDPQFSEQFGLTEDAMFGEDQEKFEEEWDDLMECEEMRETFIEMYAENEDEILHTLGTDGILALNLIEGNAGDKIAKHILGEFIFNFFRMKFNKGNKHLPV